MSTDVSFRSRYRRYLIFGSVMALLAAVVYGGAELYIGYVESHAEAFVRSEKERAARDLISEFQSYQHRTLVRLTSFSTLPALHQSFSVTTDERQAFIFSLLESDPVNGLSTEIYDSRYRLLAWSGKYNAPMDPSVLARAPRSFLEKEPIYTYFRVVLPISDGDTIAGYISSRQLFEVNFPISNRFINEGSFGSAFTSDVESEVIRIFLPTEEARVTNENDILVPLTAVHGGLLATLACRPQSPQDVAENFRMRSTQALFALLFLFALALAVGTAKAIKDGSRPALSLLAWTILIWGIRFLMLALNIPADYFSSEIFDPGNFASTFGFGLARSAGDLLITSVCLLLNVALIIQTLQVHWTQIRKRHPLPANGNRPVMVLMLTGIIMAFFVISRGYVVAVRSAVFDSTLNYHDPMYVIPSAPIGAMLLGLLTLSLAFSILSSALFAVAISGITRVFRRAGLWLVLPAIFMGANIIYEFLHPNPLLDFWNRLGYGVAFGVVAWIVRWQGDRPSPLQSVRSAIILSLISAFILNHQMDNYVHESQRSRAEALAQQLVQPMDSWLSFVVRQALTEATPEGIDTIINGTNRKVKEKLGFAAWARSLLSKEGYNCAIVYVNDRGESVSDFHVGSLHAHPETHALDSLPTQTSVIVEEKFAGEKPIKVYRGFAPIQAIDGRVIGGVQIELSSEKYSMLENEVPEFLRNAPRQTPWAYRHGIILSEFIDGRMSYATNSDIPRARALPAGIELSDSAGVWIVESIGGIEYESIYRASGEAVWIALSFQTPGWRWHVFSVLRQLFFYVIVGFAIAGVYFLAQYAAGRRYILSFRAKLLLSFVIVTAIPIVILAYYNRELVLDRANEEIVQRLRRETQTVVNVLQGEAGVDVPFDLYSLTDADCRYVTDMLGIEFNVYAGAFLLASSKPEVFVADIMSTRLDGNAYAASVLGQQGFFAQKDSIGDAPYVVAYRPLRSATGEVLGIVGVPSLYRQDEIDRELMERNAYLFGAYGLATLLALGVGYLFASQISSPVRKLVAATQQIAGGDLGVRLRSERKDEFGELEQAFDRMTDDLRTSQERMMKAQRELAWKEMAKQVAHEIKNPLTPMKLSVQHLRQASKDGAAGFATLLDTVTSMLLEQIETLSRIASEFSQFARLPERHPEEVRLNTIVSEAADLFRDQPGIKFAVSLDASDPVVVADRDELRRAFVNVIRNSVQAIEHEGSISLSTSSEDEFANVSIVDSGIGIPAAIRDRLFEPSFSTKTDGMGLGLSIVKRTIDDLGGTISIMGEAGSGTSVLIRIPLSRDLS